MSLSKRMVAAGLKAQPHPLAGWRSSAEWDRQGIRSLAKAINSTRGKWVNEIGIDLGTLADPGWKITPCQAVGFVQIGPNSYSRGSWIPDATAPPPEAKPERHTFNRRDAPGQLTMF